MIRVNKVKMGTGKYSGSWAVNKPGGALWVNGKLSMSNQFGITARVIGLNNVINNFLKEVGKLEGRTSAGLEMAAKYLHTQTESVPPTTPKLTGRLRKSWYTKSLMAASGPQIEIGYDTMGDKGAPMVAPYALYVHEMTNPPYTEPIDWTELGSGPQWFQTHIHNDMPEMLSIIAANASVEGKL
jgi:hypothetical protein